ncbi:MAG: hypothetical protein KKF27_21815 [Gammaproteobacteria bacterium]|nr:hypothetical protein [Gammaproteobacteria bacterium]
MKFLPTVLWMLLWPVVYYFTNLLSAVAYSKYKYGEPYLPTTGGVAAFFIFIWLAVGAALYYGATKL